MKLDAGEQLLVVGPKGFGKTTLIQALIARAPSVVVLDSKRDPSEWAAWGAAHGFVVTDDPRLVERTPRIIYQLDQRILDDKVGWSKPGSVGYRYTVALRGAMGHYDRAKQWIPRRNTVVVFDEGLQLLPPHRAHSEARRIFSQGRSLGITSIVGTQLANWIDTHVLRLAELVVCFRAIPDTAGRLGTARGVPSEVLTRLPGARNSPSHFAVHRSGDPSWTQYPPLQIGMNSAGLRVPAAPDPNPDPGTWHAKQTSAIRGTGVPTPAPGGPQSPWRSRSAPTTPSSSSGSPSSASWR